MYHEAMTGLITRTWRHIRRGTLLQRMREHYEYACFRQRDARWKRLTNDQVVFKSRIEPDVQMWLYRDNILAYALYCKDFEDSERRFLRTFLRPGDIFVDIGANIGLFTLIAARCVGLDGKVYAFEPGSLTYRRLSDNISLNALQNVICQQIALSDAATRMDLTIALDGWDAFSSFARPMFGDSFVTESVQCVTWDSFAAQADLLGKVTMMKIDVEGWESRVLRGAAATLARDDAPMVQIEFTEPAARAAGSSCARLYSDLEAFGFRMYRYDERTRTLCHDPLRDEYPYLNLFAIKDLAFVLSRLRRSY
jgi:FkbM family methyltransferase